CILRLAIRLPPLGSFTFVLPNRLSVHCAAQHGWSASVSVSPCRPDHISPSADDFSHLRQSVVCCSCSSSSSWSHLTIFLGSHSPSLPLYSSFTTTRHQHSACSVSRALVRAMSHSF